MAGLAEQVFAFLFKYRPLLWERGEVVLAGSPFVAIGGAALAAALVLTVLRYRTVRGETRPRDRWAMVGLRVAALALIAWVLAWPVLRVPTVIPQRNYVAVLVDESRSMRVPDEGGETRSAAAIDGFGAGSELYAALEERFLVRRFGFSTRVRSVDGMDQLAWVESRTDLAAALEGARQEMAGLPVSGVVLVTDGADNSEARAEGESESALADELLAFRSAGVPIYTVGLGLETIDPDVEVLRVDVPVRVQQGSTILAEVLVQQHGYAGDRARLDIEDAGRIVASREFDLPGDGQTVPVRLQLTAEERGARRLTFRVQPREGEALAENNQRETLLQVDGTARRILYVEGEPRFELKFLRRAVADDEALELVVLLRSAENKFLRLGVEDPEELAAGFPRTREELFRYDALLLGSVEASFFTADQLRMIGDFVGRRGGGLLVTGGRRAFADGGYRGTPLEDAIPVILESPGEEYFSEVAVSLTPAGRRHPALRIAGGETESAERWTELPHLTARNRVERVKPAAVTLLSGTTASDASQVVLAYHRFGRGLAAAFTVQDSWLWQMHADIPVDDLTHETLWRQLLRWLVSESPGRLNVSVPAEPSGPGEPLEIRAHVEDERFLRVNGASVTARLTSPTGGETEVPLEWKVERDGEYAATVRLPEEGLWRVDVMASVPDGEVVTGSAHALIGESRREYFAAGMRPRLLRRVADETGGRFYTSSDVDRLAEDIRFTESGHTVTEELDLWDMPAVFLALLGLLGGEWVLRRRRGLA
jgi:uncharacterized membrane protein